MTGYVYVLYDGISGLSKIGCTANANQSRQRNLMTSHSHELLHLLTIEVDDQRKIEREAHQHFNKSCSKGEWFKTEPQEAIEYFFNVDAYTIDVAPVSQLIDYVMRLRRIGFRTAL